MSLFASERRASDVHAVRAAPSAASLPTPKKRTVTSILSRDRFSLPPLVPKLHSQSSHSTLDCNDFQRRGIFQGIEFKDLSAVPQETSDMTMPGPRGIGPLNGTKISLLVGLAVPQEMRCAGTLWDDCELQLGAPLSAQLHCPAPSPNGAT